jgi:hypothetical protein
MNEPFTSQELIAYSLIGGIADNHKLLKDEADEPVSEILERKTDEARDCESDRLHHHTAGSAVLWNPPSPSSGAGTGADAARLQWSGQPGKLSSARDRRVL